MILKKKGKQVPFDIILQSFQETRSLLKKIRLFSKERQKDLFENSS